jgi:protein-S-isoprenylcysteine O-methyltransferase Ste14
MGRNMKRSDFQAIAIIGIILGVLLLVGGIFASRYFTRSGSPPAAVTYVFPYATYSGILFGAGAVSVFVGIAAVLLALRGNKVKPLPPPSNSQQPSLS